VLADGNFKYSYRSQVFRELIIWRRLNHKNIVPLLGIASGFGPDNSISMVSTWFTNGTLTTFLTSQHDTLHCRQHFDLVSIHTLND
jgi:serine/threonine protein kinase